MILPLRAAPKRILAIGAHADDIEIGCGGTLLRLLAENPGAHLRYVIFSATPEREVEAKAAADELGASTVLMYAFRDSFFPYAEPAKLKETMGDLRRGFDPDVIFTHRRDDDHQDHRFIGELTWNVFRDHLVLEYEIPKFEGDLGRPNIYVPLADDVARKKIDIVLRHYASQYAKAWFKRETFEAVMRLRAIECNASSGWAEAFHGRKIVL